MGSTQMIMLVFVAIFIIAFAIYSMKNKKGGGNKPKVNVNTSNEQNGIFSGVKRPAKEIVKKDMSEFIRFDKVANDMIYQQKGNKYTMVIQCKGINYELMSEIEQMAVEEGFITFLNTLKFPVQLYVQTRSIDLNENVNRYKKRLEMFEETEQQLTKKYNDMEDDIDADEDEVEYLKQEKLKYTNLVEYIGDITHYVETLAQNKQMLQRKFYIILSYYKSDLITTEKFSAKEYEELCYRELYTRAQGVIGSLMGCSITSHVLTSNELAELLYISLNKDDEKTLDIRKSIESGFYRLYTTSDDVREKRQQMLDEEIMKESMKRVEESVKEAIRAGIIVPEEDIADAVDKEIDRTAIKAIDSSRVSNEVKQELKNNITKKRKERLKSKAEERKAQEKIIEEQEAKAKENETKKEADLQIPKVQPEKDNKIEGEDIKSTAIDIEDQIITSGAENEENDNKDEIITNDIDNTIERAKEEVNNSESSNDDEIIS